MMTHEPTQEPSLEPPEQPTLPFEESAPMGGRNEPTEPETDPREVWRTLSVAMRMGGTSGLSAHDAGGDR
jgi:hypothetical protein